MATLKIGDSIPHFKLEDQNGNLIDSDNFKNEVLIIYFYPKDDTPGCTAEACAFRDSHEDFVELGAKVIGVSADSVSKHKDFVTKYKLPFTLLSDNNNELRKKFSVPKSFLGLLPGRVTYIFDKNGKLVHIYDSQLNSRGHIKTALEVVKKLVS
jgi:peroxiredoxin Q/BCP